MAGGGGAWLVPSGSPSPVRITKQPNLGNLVTLPEPNIVPKMVVSNRNLLFQWSSFRGELLVAGRVKTHSHMHFGRIFPH